ncbi:MAG: glycerol kinase, partial [Rhodospirillaceae bacterium]|nr:glycerol kinase [Rhodospirillaceae bacterium]
MRIAAVDQGTTSTRVLLVADGEAPRVAAAHRHAAHHPKPGWVEHDPEELLANIRRCLEAVGPVDAIGLDNQGETCLAWDAETGRPAGRAIVWQDARTAPELEALKAKGAEALVQERAGLPLDPYFS